MAKYQFRVEVEPRFLPEQSAPSQGIYSFAYTITITNTGDVPAQLISRHWTIANSAGDVEEIKGLGVIGQSFFASVLFMAVATTLIAPPFIKMLFAEDRDGDGKPDPFEELDLSDEYSRIG